MRDATLRKKYQAALRALTLLHATTPDSPRFLDALDLPAKHQVAASPAGACSR